MNTQRFNPVVAIEIDGLLAVPITGTPEHPPAHYLEAELTIRRDTYPHRTQDEPPWDASGTWVTQYWFSRLGLRWVKGLLERGIEVVWASTWGEYANVYFGPILGLPDLSVALNPDDWVGPTVGDVKARQMAQRYNGRPLLLVTDMLPLQGRRALLDRRRPTDRALTHLHFIPWTSSVSEGDIATMDYWLELAHSAEGHEELRRRRRLDLARTRRRRKAYGIYGGP